MADAGDLKAADALSDPSDNLEIPANALVGSDDGERGETVAGQSGGNHDAVELALADALTKAATAGQWSTVELLSRELEARRKARLQVVDLELARAKRGTHKGNR